MIYKHNEPSSTSIYQGYVNEIGPLGVAGIAIGAIAALQFGKLVAWCIKDALTI